MQKYKENPWWWYLILLCLSFIAGKPFKFFMPEFCWIFYRLDCCLQGTDHPSLVVIHRRSAHGPIYHCKLYSIKRKKPFILMRYVQPFTTILYARLGSGVSTIQVMKMVAGVINPGRPVANLYVSSNFLPWRSFLAEFGHEKSFPCGATTLYLLLWPLQQISRLASILKSHLVLCFLPKYGVLLSVSSFVVLFFIYWFLILQIVYRRPCQLWWFIIKFWTVRRYSNLLLQWWWYPL